MNTLESARHILNKYEIVIQAAAIAREALKGKQGIRMVIEHHSEDSKQDKEIIKALKEVYQINETLKKRNIDLKTNLD